MTAPPTAPQAPRPPSAATTAPVSAATPTQAASKAAVAPLSDAQREAAGWTWAEAEVIGANGKPLVGERCQWFELLATDKPLGEGRTDKNGVVRLWLPGKPTDPAEAEELRRNQAGKPPKDARTLVKALGGKAVMLVFPEILESFEVPAKPAAKPAAIVELIGNKRDSDGDPRRFDYRFHAVPLKTARHRVTLAKLTQEEKFQYLVWIYTRATSAKYVSSRVRFNNYKKIVKANHWLFPKAGVTCNTHVNFFLGYWYNYSGKAAGAADGTFEFTSEATSTEMACIALLDSGTGRFMHGGQPYNHRGYKEFIEPIDHSEFVGHQTRTSEPTRASNGFEFYPYYIRMSQFFDYDGKPIKATYDKLIAALGDFNVYSVADITDSYHSQKEKDDKVKELATSLRPAIAAAVAADAAIPADRKQETIAARVSSAINTAFDNWIEDTTYKKRNTVVASVRTWLLTHRTAEPFAGFIAKIGNAEIRLGDLTDAQVGTLTRKHDVIWRVLFNLRESEADQLAVLKVARDALNWGHHCGVMLKRDAKGEPLKEGVEGKVWKFSADNDSGKPDSPWFRPYDHGLAVGAAGSFLHLAIWKCKPLAHGGFAPQQFPANAMPKVGLNNPPRFVLPVDSTLM